MDVIKKYINESLNEEATVLGGIPVDKSDEPNPLGDNTNPAFPKGFYYATKSTDFNVPAGQLKAGQIYYATGKSTDNIFRYDLEGDRFVKAINATQRYSRYDALKMIEIFLQHTKGLTGEQTLKKIEELKGTFEGSLEDAKKYLEAAGEGTYRIQKIG